MWNPNRGLPDGGKKKPAAIVVPQYGLREVRLPYGRPAIVAPAIGSLLIAKISRVCCELWLANGLKIAKSLLVCLLRYALWILEFLPEGLRSFPIFGTARPRNSAKIRDSERDQPA